MSKENNIKTLSLDDSVIAHIARLLQVSILTGTDIVDHMRMIRLKENEVIPNEESTLALGDEYATIFDGTVDRMLKNANEKKLQEE